MLQHLSIHNFIIVRHIELDFRQGLTVFSGETGAGKSILLNAIGLTLGDRSDHSMIMDNADKAEISTQFHTDNKAIINWLFQKKYISQPSHSPIPNNTIILFKRIIDKKGKSKAFINHISAPLAHLKEIGEQLLDIHGQHAHQQLLKNAYQRDLLDEYGYLSSEASIVKKSFYQLKELEDQFQKTERHIQEITMERERLLWQLNELERLSPLEGEWENLQQEHAHLTHAARLLNGTQQLIQTLNDSDQAVLSQLSHLSSHLNELKDIDQTLTVPSELLQQAEALLNEATRELNRYAGKIDLDPERLSDIDQRISQLFFTARKFRVEPEKLPELYIEKKNAFSKLEDNNNLDFLEKAIEKARENYYTSARILSEKREYTAHQLAKEISHAIQRLGMSGGCFEITFIPQKTPHSWGTEQVEFLFAGHPGTLPKPLHKVASGGELARLSLAITVMARSLRKTPTLIFDEVDSGIGGQTAETVGQLLHQLGQQQQVLCITHLPQVAAQGHHHFCIRKVIQENTTYSSIGLLNPTERIEELARMLSGDAAGDIPKTHAQALLERTTNHLQPGLNSDE